MTYSKVMVALSVLLLCIGCGNNRQDQAPWPAKVTITGLNEAERSAVIDQLTVFSSTMGSEVFYFDDRPSQFQITITKVDPSPETSSRAGLATYDERSCTVELSRMLFTEGFSSYLEPVLWHELGHCSGMGHDSKDTELMYRLASPQESYGSDAIDRFMRGFASLTHLIVKETVAASFIN
ncbi:MAG: hypothetical protein EXR74_00735 [Bdellovibrionales bacterium]|nr:hypothetical protein [Bdellovibrionales bacterium]